MNTFGNNCNDLLSSETIMMVKERFIENYGVPLFTIGTGGSGGAYQSNQTGDNYPGLFDGIVTTSSFPDVTTGMVPMHSSRLFELYFTSRPGRYTTAQMTAMTGYLSIPGQINEMSRVRGDRMDPRIEFPDEIADWRRSAVPLRPCHQPVRRARRCLRPHRERLRRDPEHAGPRRPRSSRNARWITSACSTGCGR